MKNSSGIFHLNDILNKLDRLDKHEYFINFLDTQKIEAGIIKLKLDEIDEQTFHENDEIYYIIQGEGKIEINKKMENVKEMDIIFIPKFTEHKFISESNEIIILYILAG